MGAGHDRDGVRAQRVDARRNVSALLQAAKASFATTGVDAAAKEIADLAGVGVGTLYRHFPRRSDLILAVLDHEIDVCVDASESLAASREPAEALLSWIDRFTEFVGTKHGLATALHSGDPAYANLGQALLGRLEPALHQLLGNARAVMAREVHDDVSAHDALITIALICQPVPGESPSFNRRMARIFARSLIPSPC